MNTQEKTDGEVTGGKLMAGALYAATLLIVLAYFAQSVVSFLIP
jgi:hypothetical protein